MGLYEGMTKKIFVLAVLAVFLLSISAAYSQTVTEWERQVYYKVIDRISYLPEGSQEADYDRVAKEVAEENGLTYAEIDALGERVWDSDLSDREWDIANDLDDRISALPSGRTEADRDRVYEEVAKKYGISVAVLNDIDMRAWMY